MSGQAERRSLLAPYGTPEIRCALCEAELPDCTCDDRVLRAIALSQSPPSGLPLISTAPLTAAERELLGNLRRRHQAAVTTIDNLLDDQARGRVDQALHLVHWISGETDGLALQVAVQLGRNR